MSDGQQNLVFSLQADGVQALQNQISTYGTSTPTYLVITDVQITEQAGNETIWSPTSYYNMDTNVNYFTNLRIVPNEDGSLSTLLVTLNINCLFPDNTFGFGEWVNPTHAQNYIDIRSFAVFIYDPITATNVVLAIGTLYQPFPTSESPLYKYAQDINSPSNFPGNAFTFLMDINLSPIIDVNTLIFGLEVVNELSPPLSSTFQTSYIPPLILLPTPSVFSPSSFIATDNVFSSLATNDNITWNINGCIPLIGLSATAINNTSFSCSELFSYLPYNIQSGLLTTGIGSNQYNLNPDTMLLYITNDPNGTLTNQTFHISNLNCNSMPASPSASGSYVQTSATALVTGNTYTIIVFVKEYLFNQHLGLLVTPSALVPGPNPTIVLPNIIKNNFTNYTQIIRTKTTLNSTTDKISFVLANNGIFYFEGTMGTSFIKGIIPGDSLDLAVNFNTTDGRIQYWII